MIQGMGLLKAARKGKLDIVRSHIEQGAPKNKCDSEGTALIWASQKGHLDVAQYLVEKRARKDICDNQGAFLPTRMLSGGHVVKAN